MREDQTDASIKLGIDALHLMHRAVHQAHESWQDGCAQKQEWFLIMGNQLYAAHMDQLLHIEAI